MLSHLITAKFHSRLIYLPISCYLQLHQPLVQRLHQYSFYPLPQICKCPFHSEPLMRCFEEPKSTFVSNIVIIYSWKLTSDLTSAPNPIITTPMSVFRRISLAVSAVHLSPAELLSSPSVNAMIQSFLVRVPFVNRFKHSCIAKWNAAKRATGSAVVIARKLIFTKKKNLFLHWDEPERLSCSKSISRYHLYV